MNTENGVRPYMPMILFLKEENITFYYIVAVSGLDVINEVTQQGSWL